MDLNGTRFHMLTGAGDWRRALDAAGTLDAWYDNTRQALTLLPELPEARGASTDAVLTMDDRRGAGADAFGNLYWIDDSRSRIMILPAGMDEAGVWWSLGDLDQTCLPEDGGFAPAAVVAADAGGLSGLAVTAEHYLVVGTDTPSGLFVFDLYGGGPPIQWPWPGVPDSVPFDMAATPDGGLWILDRAVSGTRLWRLDNRLGIVGLAGEGPDAVAPPSDFRPMDATGTDGAEPCLGPSAPGPGAALPLDDSARAVAALPDNSVLILAHDGTAGPARIDRLSEAGLPAGSTPLDGPVLERVVRSVPLRVHDMAVNAEAASRPGHITGTLMLGLEDGNQAVAFGLTADPDDFELTLRPLYLPLRRFSGKALVASGGAVLHDIGDRWYRITAMPRLRHAPSATLSGLVFDGREPGCVWHRVLFDACIPRGATIGVRTRAADELALLPETDWSEPEPAPYLRHAGSEIHLNAPYGSEPSDRSGTWELLIQAARGRYIEVEQTLSGDGIVTPAIRALRLYYPRLSYAERFLPAVYREEPHAASFLERYLANVEGLFTLAEQKVAHAETLLDSRTAPPEALDWLAGWLGVALDDTWDDRRQRLMIDHAELLFRWRGTPQGIRAAIRLVTEACPDASIFDALRNGGASAGTGTGGAQVRIVERYRYRALPGVVIGDPTQATGIPIAQTSGALPDLGSPAVLSQRYRAYLERRYRARADPGTTALDALNAAWGTAFGSFQDIVFRPTQPDAARLPDWRGFIQKELVLRGTWSPEQGAYALHLRYQVFLAGRHDSVSALNSAWGAAFSSFDDVLFSPVLPLDAGAAADWRDFVAGPIGFAYATVSQSDATRWQVFLARRYRDVARLNAAHGLSGSAAVGDFAQVTLPPEDGLYQDAEPLADWIAFVSLALPIRRNAHQFTVLVPTRPGEPAEVRNTRIGQVEAVVNREKPAHTTFDTKPFWALFQVGTARLGEDSILGDSSRYVATVLDAGFLGQGLLAPSGAWKTDRRRVLDRDRLGS